MMKHAYSNALDLNIHGGNGGFRVDAAFRAETGVTALFGASGAGKTTLLRMIAGTLRPEQGRIAIGEHVLFDSEKQINLKPEQRHIGYVYQDARLFPHLTVLRNLTYAAWAGKRQPVRKLEDITALLGIEHLLQRKPHQLSGGEKQRVAIGRALLSAPKLLLLDEPLSSLDHARREEILPYLEQLRDESGLPIVFVSHEVDEVARLADTLVLLEQGRVRESGSVFDIFSQIDGSGETTSVLLKGTVTRNDDHYAMAEIAIGGVKFQLTDQTLQTGMNVRLRIRSKDVSLARTAPVGISIRNVFPVVIHSISTDSGPFAELNLQLGDTELLSRISRKSVQDLELRQGEQIFALIKAVSIDRSAVRLQQSEFSLQNR
ncbi:Vitamin B12 import ATP-binding protein BtuD [Pseudochrobactrum sp. MP213Fo]